jgi:hypothetical protein
VALVNGAAVVAADAPDAYRAQQLEALNAHRGTWLDPPPNLVIASAPVAQPADYVLVAGDDGTDGITYVGGVPEAMIDGEAVFLIYGGDAGWGYYDHWHHWRDAPYRYRAHMERFHPGGHGLRGYRDEAALHREGLHPEPVAAGAHPGEVHTAAGLAGHPGVAIGAHPSVASGGHSLVAPGAHSAVASGVRPAAAGGGFVHPGPSAAGFHPAGLTAPHAAPIVHASLGGGEKRK